MSMKQDDFRKILATPRTTSGSKPPPLFASSGTSKLNPFKKPPPRIRREGRSDVLEHSHVDLGTGFVDRAKERRLAELRGDTEDSGEVKGLDFELLKKVRSGEFVLPKFEPPPPQRDDSDDEEKSGEEDEDSILDELLQMEMELQLEQEQAEKEDADKLKEKEEEMASIEDTKSTVEEPAVGPAVEQQNRFKPIVDAKQLKQMRRERKRRKLAMEAMDRLSKPMAPPPIPKKTRAELLAELRQIQAAKNQKTSKVIETVSTSNTTVISEGRQTPPTKAESAIETDLPPQLPKTEPEKVAITTVADQELSPEPVHEPTPPRRRSPTPVKVGDNMFSDESELSDYNPFADDSDDELPATTKPQEPPTSTTSKRSYFGDQPEKSEPVPSGPITLDPTIAAALRKAASLADKKGILDPVQEERKSNRMSLGGADGVYEFDEEDTYDVDEEEDIGSKKRKRKEKK